MKDKFTNYNNYAHKEVLKNTSRMLSNFREIMTSSLGLM